MQFNPPDVSLRLLGDKNQAQGYIGAAFNMLAKALQMRNAGGDVPVVLARTLEDGTAISVKLIGNQKIVAITAYSPEELAEQRGPEPEVSQPPPAEYTATMLSGVVRSGYLETVDGKLRLDGFCPDIVCSRAYGISRAYAPSTRLAVPSYFSGDSAVSQYRFVKPSMYSGAMKRVVQAIFGLGIVSDSSKLYVTGQAPAKVKRAIQNKYSWRWTKTHGVVKSGPSNHWLVEISNSNGVLAMPLPLFGNTTRAGFRSRMTSIGDWDSVRVLDEFGGLPNGETFPTDPIAVQTLVDQGKVLRLLPPEALDEFYKYDFDTYHDYGVPRGVGSDTGWAFSDEGGEARNIVYRDVGANLMLDYNGATLGSLCRVQFHLPPHAKGEPLPAGSAEFEVLYSASPANFSEYVGSGSLSGDFGLGSPGVFVGSGSGGLGYNAFVYWGSGKTYWPLVLEKLPDFPYLFSTAMPGQVYFEGNEFRFLHKARSYYWQLRPLNDARRAGEPMACAIAPALCREATLFLYNTGNYPATPGSSLTMSQRALLAGFGTIAFGAMSMSYLETTIRGETGFPLNWHSLPPASSDWAFAASVNAGPTPLYVMHNGVQTTGGQDISVMPTAYYLTYKVDGVVYQHPGPRVLVLEGAGLSLTGYEPVDFCFVGSV